MSTTITKKDVIDHLWEKDIATADDAQAIVDAVWNVLNLPPEGNLIRIGGDLDEKIQISEGEAIAKVVAFPSDETIVKLNHMKGQPVVVFGIEAREEEEAQPSGPTEIEQLAEQNAAEDGAEGGDEEDEEEEAQPEPVNAKSKGKRK